MDSSAENLPATRPSVTDSAWFWLMLFSCMSLVAMQLIDWKYNQRQARLERQFQGRRWAAEHGAQIEMNPGASLESRSKVPLQESVVETENQAAVSAHPEYSQPGQLMISLWPLRVMAGVALGFSLFMLRKQRTQVLLLSVETEPEDRSPATSSPSSTALPAQRGVSSS